MVEPAVVLVVHEITVLAHTSGLSMSVDNTLAVYHSPSAAGAGGCSSYPSGATTHVTAGSLLRTTSCARLSASKLVKASPDPMFGPKYPNAFLWRWLVATHPPAGRATQHTAP